MAGCAGREAHPVAVTQTGDEQMSCPAIATTVSANENQIRNLQGQAESHNVDNAIVGTVGVVLFWPALFALDTTDYEKQEATALRERDEYLNQVAIQHNCGSAMSGGGTAYVAPTPVLTAPVAPVTPASTTAAAATALPYCSPWDTNPRAGSCTQRPSQMPQ
jgi:hypothetical protein